MAKAKSRAKPRSKKKSGPGFFTKLAGSLAWFGAPRRLAHMTLALVWVGLIVSSRLVLGAHWPTDVIVGVIIGCLWLAVVIVALVRAEAIAQKSPSESYIHHR